MRSAICILAAAAGLSAQVQVQGTQVQGLLQVSPQPQQLVGKASIEGTVEDAVTHEPVRKASVNLNGMVSLNAVTDASGHFAFRQLIAGQYNIQANSDRYPRSQSGMDPLTQLGSLAVTADEQKTGVVLSLTPSASLRGVITDEEGSPLPQCGVQVMRMDDAMRIPGNEGAKQLFPQGFAQSDEKGEYRVSSVPPGKYYVMARCGQSLPLPHAFIRRDSLQDVPAMTYPPVFYPGAPDVSSASRVGLSPGAIVGGIDFRLSPANEISVRGRVRQASSDQNEMIQLRSRGPIGMMGQQGAPINRQTGEFRFRNVEKGSYELVVNRMVDGRAYFADVPIEVGVTPLDPIDVQLAPAPQVSGTVSFEGDTNVELNKLRVMLSPLGNAMGVIGPAPNVTVESDGKFTLGSVTPGKWRVQVSGSPGYIKSISAGEQEGSSTTIEVGASAAPLKIVMSSKMAEITSRMPAGAGSNPLSMILWAANDGEFRQSFPFNPQTGSANIQVPPGRYYLCAIGVAQPSVILQRASLRKAIEDHCQAVEASEGSHANVQPPLLSFEDVKKLIETVDE